MFLTLFPCLIATFIAAMKKQNILRMSHINFIMDGINYK